MSDADDQYRPPRPPEAWSRDAVRSESDVPPATWGAPAAWAPPSLPVASQIAAAAPVPRRRRRWPWVVGGAIALVGLLTVGGVAAARKSRSSEGSANSSPKSVKPTDWDPRIADLAMFVEQRRGLKFAKPVELRLLDDEAWSNDTERSSSATMNTAVAEALGLFPQGLDGDGARNRATTAAYSGFTSGGTSIGVHGTQLDAFTRSQVVHALTHAVVAQNRALVSNDGAFRSASSQQRIDYAVLEGDASRVENEWVASLPAAERAEVKTRLAAIDAANDRNAPPEFLIEWMLPDLFGDEFVHAISQLGPDERNRLYREPPEQDAGMFDPSRYRDPAPPIIAEEVEVDEGFTEVAEGSRSVGSWLWFLSLASGDSPAVVRAAMSGYQNDTAIVMRSKSSVCLKAIVVPTGTGMSALAAAFGEWTKSDPTQREATRRSDGSIIVRSCSTDRLSSSVVRDRIALHVRELSARNELAGALLEARIETDLRRAVCVAEQTLLSRGTAAVEATVSPEVGPPLQPELVALVAGSPPCAA
jgi:hypothetical protein